MFKLKRMGKILKYKTVDVSHVSLEKPFKINGVYTSKVLYQNDDLFIQSPVIELVSEKQIQFSLVKKGQFFTCFEELYNKIVDILYTNSDIFFKKSFSEARIQESIPKIVNINGNMVTFGNGIVSYENDIKVYNSFKDSILFSESLFPVNAVIIMKFDSLIFKGKSVIPIIKITHVKIDYSSNKKKNSDCILNDDSSESDFEVVNKTVQSDELDVIIQNRDSEDYFDDE